MNILNINNFGLISYYLEQKIYEIEKSGLVIITDEDGEEPDKIELHYDTQKDLEDKLSHILMCLTDK